MSTQNALHVIAPYRDEHSGAWVFDDPSVGLEREPFVMGIPAMIHFVTEHAGITDPERGFRCIFSGQAFPNFNVRLRRMHSESGGTWYALMEMHTDDGQHGATEGLHLRGWLCPALYKYFTYAPENLYVRVEALTAED